MNSISKNAVLISKIPKRGEISLYAVTVQSIIILGDYPEISAISLLCLATDVVSNKANLWHEKTV